MGNRGRLATLKLVNADRLEDMTPPEWLDPEAKAYWIRHAENLSANGLLTTASADTFAMLCDCYSRYRREERPAFIIQLGKLYITYAKQYRLLPVDAKGVGAPEVRHGEKRELDFA